MSPLAIQKRHKQNNTNLIASFNRPNTDEVNIPGCSEDITGNRAYLLNLLLEIQYFCRRRTWKPLSSAYGNFGFPWGSRREALGNQIWYAILKRNYIWDKSRNTSRLKRRVTTDWSLKPASFRRDIFCTDFNIAWPWACVTNRRPKVNTTRGSADASSKIAQLALYCGESYSM